MDVDTFNFDEWSRLAKYAPEIFEARRSIYIERVISESHDIRFLRGLQCRIDMVRIRELTTLKACQRISSMMLDSFFDLRNEVELLLHLISTTEINVATSINRTNHTYPAKKLR